MDIRTFARRSALYYLALVILVLVLIYTTSSGYVILSLIILAAMIAIHLFSRRESRAMRRSVYENIQKMPEEQQRKAMIAIFLMFALGILLWYLVNNVFLKK